MGRKSVKSQIKQQRMKEEKKQLAVSMAAVKKANALEDPLAEFPVFNSYTKNGFSVRLICARVKDLMPDVMQWILDLMKRNMEQVYNQCEWGWNGEKKREEMTEDAAWYLVAFTTEGNQPVAFSHFRFDIDFGYEVLYVYELQIEPEHQRKGLGKFMAQVLELIAFKNNMRKVVLTVLKHNKAAIDFYSSLKYVIDETCPEDNFEEQFCYLILSKPNRSFKQPAAVEK
uniref:N-alpha-acetyltransferase 40 n=1 Tax=Lygus hesperus TaxID=30085 RepID=A0A0A9ZD19_LYGHE